MKIKSFKNYFQYQLLFIYDKVEIDSFFYLILEDKNNLKRIDIALNVDLEFSENEISTWQIIFEQLKLQIPIQYILGKTSFFGLEFIVNNQVLIPRPETEELVDWIISKNQTQKSEDLKILDIGTGSGCIAISLAKNLTNAQVSAIDVSAEALDIAQKNALNNKVEIAFIQENILETATLHQKYDLIVSNPPYVRNLEKAEIQKNVLDHEPHLALFVADNDALVFYKKIAILAKDSLNENGQLYFEINQYLGKETIALLEFLSYKNIQLKKDIYGNDRMIFAEV